MEPRITGRYARRIGSTLIGAGLLATALPASAVVMFDQDVTAIFGSGNADTNWTVDRAANVELALRAKLRFDAANNPQNIFNSNGDGTYSFDAGLPPAGFPFASGSTSTAVWNFEWSINTDVAGTAGRSLDDLTYTLDIDFDPGLGTNFLTFDLINVPPTSVPDFADHAIGNNATPNGGGTTATDRPSYLGLIAANNVAQNSWNMEFFDNAGMGFPFDGRTQGVYDFRLTAFDAGSQVASVSIQVETVPEPASLALLGLGLVGLRIGRRRRA